MGKIKYEYVNNAKKHPKLRLFKELLFWCKTMQLEDNTGNRERLRICMMFRKCTITNNPRRTVADYFQEVDTKA